MNRKRLIEELIYDEGYFQFPYLDTVEKTTIGVGRNLTDRGLSDDEIMMLLNNDIDIVEKELAANFSWYPTLPEPQQRALCNMAFNMGLSRLKSFKKMLASLSSGMYVTASLHALDSKWAKQVKTRAERVTSLMKE
tara:strand:+ start:1072 stop:1479 length:408 start_codon:yes stop_codon:yes gene_type:complete